MYHMILLVLDNLEQYPALLDAWEQAGAPGVTILESTGLGRVRQWGMRDDVPLMPSLSDFLTGPEEHHRTLFTVIEGEALVDGIIAATEAVLGDLEQPDNGFLVVLPALKVKGLMTAKARGER